MNAERIAAVVRVGLIDAAEAEARGDHTGHLHAVESAAVILAAAYAKRPAVLPEAFAILRAAGPAVRRSDLLAAAEMASDHVAGDDGPPTLLHPDCDVWIGLACRTHDADADRVAARLAVQPEPGAVRRDRDLPVSDELEQLVGSCVLADLLAARDVVVSHADALAATGDALSGLFTLVQQAVRDGATLGQAVEELHGPDRVRAEELCAALPSVLNVGGGAQ